KEVLVTPSLTRSDSSTVCVIQPSRDVYSETFIRNHAERLPARVRVLYDGWFPTRCENDTRLLPAPFALMSKVEARLPPSIRTISVAVRNRILVLYLRSNRVEVVIAEYGPTGVAVMDACRHASVPFIVHFHGFDAYHYPTLDAHVRDYKRMFVSATA